MRTCVRWAFITSSLFFLAIPARSQSLGNESPMNLRDQRRTLTNTVALYSFLSTFSGTHFLQPRTAGARFGLVF